jgi:hypothetical protein
MAAAAAGRRADFGAGSLFLADSRLLLVVLNQLRYRALHRAFGVSREQANLLTLVLVMAGTQGTVTKAGRIVRAPFQIARMDAVIGGFTLREAAIGVAGRDAREVSPFATLLTLALVGGFALPAVRRTAHRLRAAERRLRTLRESQYASARRALRSYGRATDEAGAVRSPTM